MAPFNCDSGTLRGQRKIRGGRKRLRRVLYSATVASVRCNPVLRPYYRRLRATGKPAKVALVAAMHKMILILNAMLKTQTAISGPKRILENKEEMYKAEYKAKFMSPAAAVELIPARGTLSMGMAVSEPPALLAALEDRVKRGEIEELRVYYSHSVTAAANTILKYEYMNVIKPHPFFPTIVERTLFELGRQDNRQVIFYMPGNFSAMPRTLAEIGIDAFVMMVAPMDSSGFFSCGTNGDYTIPTARTAKKLIVEVNPKMPRVFGDSSVHISEIDAIVENESTLFVVPAAPPPKSTRQSASTSSRWCPTAQRFKSALVEYQTPFAQRWSITRTWAFIRN